MHKESDEVAATRAALRHVGADDEPVEKIKRHRGPLQEERLFQP